MVAISHVLARYVLYLMSLIGASVLCYKLCQIWALSILYFGLVPRLW